MYQTIRYEKNGNIGIATISRPEALNALNSTVISELEQLITEVEKDAELGAFILTGDGRSFVAGADIGEQYPLDVAGGRKVIAQRGEGIPQVLVGLPLLKAGLGIGIDVVKRIFGQLCIFIGIGDVKVSACDIHSAHPFSGTSRQTEFPPKRWFSATNIPYPGGFSNKNRRRMRH